MKPDPMGEPRNPWHVFLFSIVIVNGLSFALGQSTSAAMAGQLSPENLRLYGLLLGSGGGLVVIGMFWPGDPRTGLVTKRVGYFGLGAATIIYSLAVLAQVRTPDAVLAASVAFTFGCMCFWQVRAINKRVRILIKGL